ncbi:alpha/beta hydrolase [Iamia sp.]|uniref:alpha/beta hydrolase family protein n=1 Tax=Iamia sp. TaxID=2722710 RepID=UPI002CFE5569|nr:alpha/beta hydrolase [Iamia sp.]HXH58201.1 alpha/beta hydrolase [Iamia sp.]
MPVEEHPVRSGDLALVGHLARPRARSSTGRPGLVLTHGLPPATAGAAAAGTDLPELADRIATTLGWVVLTVRLRGAGGSEGDFSLGGWQSDLEAGLASLRAVADVQGTWLAGFGTGGGLAICAGAADPGVAGVAALAAPADFDDWAGHPRRLLQHTREIGIISTPGFPAQPELWSRELRDIRPVARVARLAPRPLLVVHGLDDEAVPQFDARVLSDAHGSAELRMIGGAGHQLRHDPRAIAVLLGWLDRQANT